MQGRPGVSPLHPTKPASTKPVASTGWKDLASELPSHMESCDAYANSDNSHLTGELQMLICEMRKLQEGNVFEIARSVKTSLRCKR